MWNDDDEPIEQTPEDARLVQAAMRVNPAVWAELSAWGSHKLFRGASRSWLYRTANLIRRGFRLTPNQACLALELLRTARIAGYEHPSLPAGTLTV